MEKLSLLLQENEDLVIEKVLHYAQQHSYYKFLTGLHQPWVTAVGGLNSLLISSWNEDNPEGLESGLKTDLKNCPISKFVSEAASKHRCRGVGPGMFLGMLKYFRRSYLDLISSAHFDRKYERLCFYFIANFFDRMEMRLNSTWSENDSEILKELQLTNREITSEKIKYITIFEILPTPAILLDESNRIESVNHSFTQIFPSPEKVCNWLAGELNGFKFSQLLHKRFEKSFVTKETTKYFEIQMKRMLDLKAKHVGTVIILNDITAGVKSQQVLKENEELFRSYFENSAIGTAFVSLEGSYLKVNRTLCNILGYSADELLNSNVIGHTHPEDVEASLNFIQTVLSGEKDSFMYEKRYIHKEGYIVWVQIISSLVKDISGKPLYFAAQTVNITERKLADIAFRESREQFRNLFNNSNDMLFLRELEIGLPKRIIDVSDLASGKLGYTKDELLKMSVEDLLTENSLEKYNSLKTGDFKSRHTSLELDCIAKDKNIVPIEVTIISQMEDVAGSLAIVRDISQRKKIKIMIQESEELYRSYFEDSAIGMAFVGVDGRYKLVNEAMCELSGYSKQELYQMGIKDISHPEDYPRDLVAVENLLSSKIKTSHLEKRYYHKKGHIVWVKASATLSYDNLGSPSHFIVQIRDITPRKITEEALKLSEERFITLFDNASDVITIHKVNEHGMPGSIVEVNKRACLKLRYSKEDFYSLTENDLLTKKSIETLHSVFKKEPQATRFYAELDVLTKSGSKIPFEINYHLFEFQGQKLMFAISRDISERKKLEDEYIRSSKLDSLTLLAGGIAHDFRNFLTIILGNVSLAKFQFKEQNDVLSRLQKIEKAAQEANKITTQLLTFAKGGELNKEAFDFGSVLKDTAFLSLSGSVCTCEVNVQDNLWLVEADKGQIVQVLNNLVLNADQSMPKGGTIKVTAENHIIDTENHKLKEGPYIKLTIEDEGFGIEPEHLSKVFEPYYTTKEKGHGLGLATCYLIIKKHGGHIEVRSEAGPGTMFTIYLPSSITDLENKSRPLVKS